MHLPYKYGNAGGLLHGIMAKVYPRIKLYKADPRIKPYKADPRIKPYKADPRMKPYKPYKAGLWPGHLMAKVYPRMKQMLGRGHLGAKRDSQGILEA